MLRRLVNVINKRQDEETENGLFWNYMRAAAYGTPEQHSEAYREWRKWCNKGYDLSDDFLT